MRKRIKKSNYTGYPIRGHQYGMGGEAIASAIAATAQQHASNLNEWTQRRHQDWLDEQADLQRQTEMESMGRKQRQQTLIDLQDSKNTAVEEWNNISEGLKKQQAAAFNLVPNQAPLMAPQEHKFLMGGLIGAGLALDHSIGNAIAGDYRSGAGEAISSVPGFGLIGGLVNRAFGIKENKAEIQRVATEKNALTNQAVAAGAARSFDSAALNAPQAVNSQVKAYEGGWFSGGKADRKNAELREQLLRAENFAQRSVDNGIGNVTGNITDRLQGSYYDLGGVLEGLGSMLGGSGGSTGASPQPMVLQSFRPSVVKSNGGALDFMLMQDALNNMQANSQTRQRIPSVTPTNQPTLFKNGGSFMEDMGVHNGLFGSFYSGNGVTASQGSPIYNDHIRGIGDDLSTAYRNATKDDKKAIRKATGFSKKDFGNFLVGNYSPLYAFGGDLMTNGGDFSNGTSLVGNGGTHEANPYNGVQMGIAPDGQPNLVEEGEVIYKDYVFSNRLKITKRLRDKYNLKSMTFAEAAKKLQAESSERPNDPISQSTLKAFMTDLSTDQEEVKAKAEERKARQYAKGGEIETTLPEVTVTAKAPSLESLKGKYLTPNQVALFSSATGQTAQPFTDINEYLATITPDEQTEFIQKYNEERDKEKMLEWLLKGGKYPYYAEGGALGHLFPGGGGMSTMEEVLGDTTNDTTEEGTDEEEGEEDSQDKKKKKLPTWLRYAPIVGSGVGAIASLFDKPNYDHAEAIESAANVVAPAVGFNPIGEYLTYNPLDRNYYLNQMRSAAASSRRALLNASGLNRGTAAANILASDYNFIGNMGNLARQAEEYNLGQRERVATFNRATNMFNSEGQMKADVANQSAQMQAAKLNLEGIMQAAALKQAEDDRVKSARQAAWTLFMENLGALGSENFAFNQARSNQALGYTTDTSGNSSKKAKGGMLTKKKGGRYA